MDRPRTLLLRPAQLRGVKAVALAISGSAALLVGSSSAAGVAAPSGPAQAAAPFAFARAAEESKAERTARKAAALAKGLAKGVDGSDRAAVRRGVTITLELKTGRAGVRLQVLRGKRWSTVASVRVPQGTTKRLLKPGPVGAERLAAATVTRGKVSARYAVSLIDGRTEGAATAPFKLKR